VELEELSETELSEDVLLALDVLEDELLESGVASGCSNKNISNSSELSELESEELESLDELESLESLDVLEELLSSDTEDSDDMLLVELELSELEE